MVLAKWLGAGVVVAGGLVAANWSLQSPTPNHTHIHRHSKKTHIYCT